MPTGVHVELVLAVGGRFPEATGPAQTSHHCRWVSCPFTGPQHTIELQPRLTTAGSPRLPFVSTLRLTRSRTWAASRVPMMTTTDASRRAMTRRAPPTTTTRAHARAHTPHPAAMAAPHNDLPPPRGPRDPRRPWRCVVPYLHRPRRPVLLGRLRRLHPSHLLGSASTHTTRRAHRVTAPVAAAARAPTPRPRRACASRRATLPLLAGRSIRPPALAWPRLAPP